MQENVKTKSPKVAASVPNFDIEVWPVERLRPYERNARVHPPEQIRQLRAAFREFGQIQPILVREDGTIICGHGRFEAAVLERFKTMRVIVARGWTVAQCRAFALLDNKIALNSEWDDEMLKLEIGDLSELDEIDLGIVGFSDKELERLSGVATTEEEVAAQLSNTLSYAVVVRCTGEAHQLELLKKLKGDGLKCEALIS